MTNKCTRSGFLWPKSNLYVRSMKYGSGWLFRKFANWQLISYIVDVLWQNMIFGVMALQKLCPGWKRDEKKSTGWPLKDMTFVYISIIKRRKRMESIWVNLGYNFIQWPTSVLEVVVYDQNPIYMLEVCNMVQGWLFRKFANWQPISYIVDVLWQNMIFGVMALQKLCPGWKRDEKKSTGWHVKDMTFVYISTLKGRIMGWNRYE